jgi:hypothetical protein
MQELRSEGRPQDVRLPRSHREPHEGHRSSMLTTTAVSDMRRARRALHPELSDQQNMFPLWLEGPYHPGPFLSRPLELRLGTETQSRTVHRGARRVVPV